MENKRHILLLELLDLTKRQEQALIKEEIERFESLVEDKQKVIEMIDTLSEQQSGVKDQKEEAILKEIIGIDDSNRLEFEKQLEAVKVKLKGIRQKKKRDNFYSNPYNKTFEEGVFYDKKEF